MEAADSAKYGASLWAQSDKDFAKVFGVLMQTTGQAGSRKSPPLRRDSGQECPASATGASVAGTGEDGHGEVAEVVKDRAARGDKGREKALQVRATNMRIRAGVAGQKTANHERTRLRLKISSVLQAVVTRVELHERQEKARKFREGKRVAGLGPDPSLGDADMYALGLTGVNKDDHLPGEEIVVTPRRVAILDGISLVELDMLRADAWFFFKGPVVDEASKDASPNGGFAGQSSSTESAEDASLEPLINFFTPPREETDVPIQEYARKLRAQLTPPNPDYGNQIFGSSGPGSMTDGESAFGLAPSLNASDTWDPLDRMPCLGRKPGVRSDEASPVLTKVREVYNRRDEADAKWVEDRREAMVRRFALNDFKAQEQIRERQLEIFKQKELHKVRMLEAEERKEMLDAELYASNQIADAVKTRGVRVANNRADCKVEEKRDKATEYLKSWYAGVERSDRYLAHREMAMTQAAEVSWATKMGRLDKIGFDRHNRSETHSHRNDMLKASIQASTKGQIDQRRHASTLAIAEAQEAKQQAAAQRREKGYVGRYGFVERAFGSEATSFDPKNHWMTPDRRDASWQKHVEGWKSPSISASAPSLRATM